MKDIVSCCGIVCSKCSYYPDDCPGCTTIKGKAFWLQFTGGDICSIYDCCINQNRYSHCGKCTHFPCEHFLHASDPTKSKEENDAILKNQIIQLRSM